MKIVINMPGLPASQVGYVEIALMNAGYDAHVEGELVEEFVDDGAGVYIVRLLGA